jgi:hypothetical protein
VHIQQLLPLLAFELALQQQLVDYAVLQTNP